MQQQKLTWYLKPLKHHGLVDVSSSLELDDSVGVGWGGVGVSQGAPSLCRLDLQLNQRSPFFFGPRGDGGVLRHQLTTAAPEQQQRHCYQAAQPTGNNLQTHSSHSISIVSETIIKGFVGQFGADVNQCR